MRRIQDHDFATVTLIHKNLHRFGTGAIPADHGYRRAPFGAFECYALSESGGPADHEDPGPRETLCHIKHVPPTILKK
ncbi:hypothetical protein BPY_19200 [Bifidobacterium psychraerophilum]